MAQIKGRKFIYGSSRESLTMSGRLNKLEKLEKGSTLVLQYIYRVCYLNAWNLSSEECWT
jgi:hypothetical protein